MKITLPLILVIFVGGVLVRLYWQDTLSMIQNAYDDVGSARTLSSISDLAELSQADSFTLLYDLNNKEYAAAQRLGVEPDDSLIRHMLAIKNHPKGTAWLPQRAFAPLSLEQLPWNDLELLTLSTSPNYRSRGLPPLSKQHILRAWGGRYLPDPQQPNDLWYDVIYYELKSGHILCSLTKIPYALLEGGHQSRAMRPSSRVISRTTARSHSSSLPSSAASLPPHTRAGAVALLLRWRLCDVARSVARDVS